MMRSLLFSLLLIICFSSAFAQGNRAVKGSWYTPDNQAPQSFDWQAQWIWVDEKRDADVLLARRSFELKPEELISFDKAQLRITASTHYQLYLNGQYIAQGPSRCAPHHQSFDIWEVKKLLQAGKNTIAVRVHYQQGKYAYHFDGRAGLLVQLNFSGEGNAKRVIASNQDWKAAPDLSWDPAAPKISRFQLVVADRVDFRQYAKDWYTIDFDDSAWLNATPLFRKVGWPSVQKNDRAHALAPPWTSLVPRDLPYLVEMEMPALLFIENQVIASPEADAQTPINLKGTLTPALEQSWKDYQKGEGILSIPKAPAGKKHFLLFDFGKLRTGTPILEIEGEAGMQVEVRCAPFLVNNQFNHKVVFSYFNDQLTLSGGLDRWEATYWKPSRYLALVLDNPSEVKIHRLAIRALNYPFEQKGNMMSEEAPWVQAYIDATAKTIEACTTDGYTDNYRERRQYAQTGYYGAMGNYWIFGDTYLQRRYLLQVAQEQEANGMMPAYAPLAKDDFMIIMDSNCLWIRSLREYFLHSGDEATVRHLLPAAQQLMALLHSYTNKLGLIDNPPYPYWLDHAVIDRRGANLNLNGHYLGALEDFADVLNWLGEETSSTYTQRADLVRQSIRENFWDEEKQLFADALIDGERSTQFGEHANAMALALKVASPQQAKAVAEQLLVDDELNYVKRANGMIMVTPAMSYFLHKGLCNYGYIDESLALFRKRFDKMLAPNTNQTLFEEWWLDKTGRSGQAKATSRSDAQTESCFPPALFGEFLLGVRPTQPGMREIEVFRSSTHLGDIEGNIPSPYGTLTVKWQLKSTQDRSLHLEIPRNMQVVVDLASLSSPTILINGKTPSKIDQEAGQLRLANGIHVIKF